MSNAEQNLSERSVRAGTSGIKFSRGRGGGRARVYRTPEQWAERERRSRERAATKAVKELREKQFSFSQVVITGEKTGAITMDVGATKVSEGVQWHTKKGGRHGGPGEGAKAPGDEEEEFTDTGDEGGPETGGGTTEGGRGRTMTVEGTVPADLAEAQRMADDLIERSAKVLKAMDKALGGIELEEELGGEFEEEDGEEAEEPAE